MRDDDTFQLSGLGTFARARLQVMLACLLFLTILTFGAGSSSVPQLTAYAQTLRWGVLLVYATTAVVLAWITRGPGRPNAFSLGAVGALLLAAVVSSAWSVVPRLSLERSGTFVLLLLSVISTGLVCGRSVSAIRRMVVAMVSAAGVFAVGGLLLAVAQPLTAFQLSAPVRFRGLGGNPNTAPLLYTVALPLAVWLIVAQRARRRTWVAVVAILVQSIFLSGARGAILADTVAMAFFIATYRASRRWRIKAGVIVLSVILYGLYSASLLQFVHLKRPLATRTTIQALLPAPASTPCQTSHTGVPLANPRPVRRPTIVVTGPATPLAAVGLLIPRVNSLLDGSGRLEAWRGALRLGNQKPLAGHGFGSEETAFAPTSCRLLQVFDGGHVENSYLGLYVQLGLLGLLCLLAVVAGVVRTARFVVRQSDGPGHGLALALSAALLAGAVAALFQSYFYSVGDIASLTLWTCAGFFLGTPAPRTRTSTVGLGLRWVGARSRRLVMTTAIAICAILVVGAVWFVATRQHAHRRSAEARPSARAPLVHRPPSRPAASIRVRVLARLPASTSVAARRLSVARIVIVATRRSGEGSVVLVQGGHRRVVTHLVGVATSPGLLQAAGSLYLVGGTIGGSPTNRVMSIDLATGAVHQQPVILEPLSDFGVAELRGVTYVAGGLVPGAYATAIFRFIPPAALSLVARLPYGVAGAAMAAAGGRIYIAGGTTRKGVSRQAFAFDPATATLHRLPPLPVPVSKATFVEHQARLYLVGGESSRHEPLRSILRFDSRTGRARLLQRVPPGWGGTVLVGETESAEIGVVGKGGRRRLIEFLPAGP